MEMDLMDVEFQGATCGEFVHQHRRKIGPKPLRLIKGGLWQGFFLQLHNRF